MWSSTFLLSSYNSFFNPLAPSYSLTSRHQLPIVSKIESRWNFHLCHRTKNSQIFFGDFFEELNRIRLISCTSVFVTTRSSSQKKRQDLKYLIPASSEKLWSVEIHIWKKVKLVKMKVSYSVKIGHFWIVRSDEPCLEYEYNFSLGTLFIIDISGFCGVRKQWIWWK